MKQVLLVDVARVVSGGTPKTGVPEYWDGDVLWATPKDLGGLKTVEIASTPRKLSQAGLKASSAEILPTNSVLFSSRAPIGLIAVNSVPMATNQGFKSFVPDPQKLDAGYLYRWLEWKREWLQSLGVGATFKEISKAAVSRIEIPLPPLDEQRRIAAILDKADELRTKRREALAHFDTLTHSMFQEIERQAGAMPRIKLSEVCVRIQTGPFGSLLHKEDYVADGIPLVNPMHIRDGKIFADPSFSVSAAKFDQLDSYRLVPGDVVLGRRGELGRCAEVRDSHGPMLCGTGSLIVRPSVGRLSSTYLSAVLSSRSVKNRLSVVAQGATMLNLNTKIVGSLEIPLPPLELQRTFATRVDAVERLKEMHRKHLTGLDALFASLQHRAFKGEL